MAGTAQGAHSCSRLSSLCNVYSHPGKPGLPWEQVHGTFLAPYVYCITVRTCHDLLSVFVHPASDHSPHSRAAVIRTLGWKFITRLGAAAALLPGCLRDKNSHYKKAPVLAPLGLAASICAEKGQTEDRAASRGARKGNELLDLQRFPSRVGACYLQLLRATSPEQVGRLAEGTELVEGWET